LSKFLVGFPFRLGVSKSKGRVGPEKLSFGANPGGKRTPVGGIHPQVTPVPPISLFWVQNPPPGGWDPCVPPTNFFPEHKFFQPPKGLFFWGLTVLLKKKNPPVCGVWSGAGGGAVVGCPPPPQKTGFWAWPRFNPLLGGVSWRHGFFFLQQKKNPPTKMFFVHGGTKKGHFFCEKALFTHFFSLFFGFPLEKPVGG